MVVNRVSVVAWVGAMLLVSAAPAWAQIDGTSLSTRYNTANTSTSQLAESTLGSAPSDARPGEYYFALGVKAVRDRDYEHAVEMYKVAASWAYKPAEYNLAIMYYKGDGVPADHARGTAWMILAAERGDNEHYNQARDLMVSSLSKAEFATADRIWNELKPTYGDEVALKRAKAQWRRVSMNRTGTRVGDRSLPIAVGMPGSGAPTPTRVNQPAGRGHTGMDAHASFGVTGGNTVDGSVAYGQMDRSSNPYDPAFTRNRTGTVTVEPLQHLPANAMENGQDGKAPASASSANPPPQN